MAYEIELRNIWKKYQDHLVLKDLNQVFSEGCSYAFAGHNGCGKSTLLRILSGLTTPTKGTVNYSKKLSFAYIPEKFRPVKLTARGYLKALGEIDRISLQKLNSRIVELAKEFFMEEMLDVPLYSLSKGTLQKVLVIQALLKETDILLLDEPLSGQDVESQAVFVNHVNRLREKGITVLIACHEKWLFESIADRVFTFRDKQLIPFYPDSGQQYILRVTKTADSILPWESMLRYGDGYQLIVKEEEIQPTIKRLWETGWKLKGMYDENNQVSKISAEYIL